MGGRRYFGTASGALQRSVRTGDKGMTDDTQPSASVFA
jgi:hypothetical protein